MSTSRQLAAIMFADIVGYTALMQNDENTANLVRNKFKKVLEEEVKSFKGRIIQLNGDGALCMFKSAIEAVKAGIEIQKQLRENPAVPLRIGIHSGDVIAEGRNIFGDGVNIASRIESFGVAGSVFLSDKVYDEIKNHVDINAVLLGTFNLKNVKSPIQIYAVSNDGLVVPTKKMLDGKGQLIDTSKKYIYLTGALLITILVVVSIYKMAFSPGNMAHGKSIAVLPFTNIGNNPENEYLSDGITEDILTSLTKIADLKVISRNSSMQFKGSKKSTKQIADELGVSTVLEGSVQRFGDKIKITAQLIDAKTDHSIWADTYDKEFNEVFEFQNEVAKKIAASLKAKLSVSEAANIHKSMAVNTEAYNLMLQGRYFRRQRGKENLEKSIRLLQESLQLDSTNAQAWAELALSYSDQADDGYVETGTGYFKANEAVQRALSMPDAPAVAHLAAGYIQELYYWDWDAAELEYQKALKKEPGNADVLRYIGGLQETKGMLETALEYYRKSLSLDPLSAPTLSYMGYCLLKSGRLDEAEATYKRLLEFQPNRPDAHESLGSVYILKGNYKQAFEEMKKETEELWRLYGLTQVYFATGMKKEAEETTRLLTEKYESEAGYQLAQIYACQNNHDKAFYYLNYAFDQRDAGLAEMISDPFLKNIRNDPRWNEFLKKMKLM